MFGHLAAVGRRGHPLHHGRGSFLWMPACAGMTGRRAGMTMRPLPRKRGRETAGCHGLRRSRRPRGGRSGCGYGREVSFSEDGTPHGLHSLREFRPWHANHTGKMPVPLRRPRLRFSLVEQRSARRTLRTGPHNSPPLNLHPLPHEADGTRSVDGRRPAGGVWIASSRNHPTRAPRQRRRHPCARRHGSSGRPAGRRRSRR